MNNREAVKLYRAIGISVRGQKDDVIKALTGWQRQPVAVVIVGLVVATVIFVTLCLTYDAQLYYTPANFVRDHHAIPVRSVYRNGRGLRQKCTKRVLLVPYHRGGSSFLGEMFGENPNAFYWYEPLRNMYREFPAHLRTHIDVIDRFYDVTPEGNLTALPRHLLDLITTVLHAALSCDVRKIDKHVLGEEFMLRWVHMPRVRSYSECMILNVDNVFGPQSCAEILRLTCLQSDAIVVKTLRFPVYAISDLLSRDPNIKVIYYVRDPRAILMSRADRFGETPQEMTHQAKFFCRQLAEDYKHYTITKENYPNNIILIKYEDLALNPTRTAKYIYEYINTTFPDTLHDWIKANTRAATTDGRIGTIRNSTAAASKWRHLMDSKISKEITNTCRNVLEMHRYKI